MCHLEIQAIISAEMPAWSEGDREGTKWMEDCMSSGILRVLYVHTLQTLLV